MTEPIAQEAAPVNIAEMLAKQGAKTDDSPIVYTAPDTTPNQEAPPVEQPKEQEQPKTETVVTAPAPEAPRPPEPPRQVEQPQAEIDWRDTLKKQSEVEVYKALGLDDKMINFLSRWRGGEDLKDYLEAIATDFTKMSPEEVMKRQLMRDYGGLSPEDFEELYRMKITEQFKLDSDVFDEKEVRRGKILLGIEADKVRQDFIKKQQELLFNKPPEPAPSTEQLEATAQLEQREKDLQTYRGLVETNQYTKELMGTKLLKIGEGDKAFNLEVANPNEVLDLLYDPLKWSQKLWNEDGTPNIRKQLILGAIANDDNTFFVNLAKHYEMLGAKKIAEKIENPSEPQAGVPVKGNAESQDPIFQLARFGVITSG